MKLKCCAAALLLAFTLSLHAQTVGGHSPLNSKTWTFSALSADLSATSLFTPTDTSDFLMTVYIGSTLNSAVGGQICATISWTDENGAQSKQFTCSTLTGVGPVTGNAALPIHALVGTSVNVSAAYQVPPGTPVATYNLIVGRVKLNP